MYNNKPVGGGNIHRMQVLAARLQLLENCIVKKI